MWTFISCWLCQTIFTLCYCQCALCNYFLLTLLIFFFFFLRFSICSIPFSPCLTHEAYCINHLFVFFPLYFISLVCNFCSSSSYFLCFMFLFAFKNSFLLVIPPMFITFISPVCLTFVLSPILFSTHIFSFLHSLYFFCVLSRGLSQHLETGCPNIGFIDFCVSKVWYKVHTTNKINPKYLQILLF